MKPELSFAATGSLPRDFAKAKPRWKVSSEVVTVRTTSTSCMRDEQQIHDEAGAVLRGDRLLAKGLREGEAAMEGLLGGRDRSHDLDELHEGHRVEEVQTDDAVGPSGRGGHGRD